MSESLSFAGIAEVVGAHVLYGMCVEDGVLCPPISGQESSLMS